jgi:hypothetical protein
MNEGAGRRITNLIYPNNTDTLLTTAIFSADKVGICVHNPHTGSSNGIKFSALKVIGQDEGSIVILVKALENSSVSSQTFFSADTIDHRLLVSSSDTLKIFSDGRQRSFSVIYGINSLLMVVFTYKKNTDSQRLFINKIEIAPGAASGTWGSTNVGQFARIGNNASISSYHGKFFYTYIYKREISLKEIKDLYEAPYQFIKPVTHRFYSIGGVTPPETFMANLYFM